MKKSDRHTQILTLVQNNTSKEMLSTKQLAQRFEVSEATIRRDFQELANAGLIERHYGGAQPVRSASTQLQQVGILLASRIDKYSDPFYNLVLQGSDKTLGKLGYHVAYIKTFHDVQTAEQARELIETFDVKGIILMGTTRDESIRYLRENFAPIVTITDVYGVDGELIAFNGRQGIYDMVGHLHSLGYQRPGYISGYADDRYTGFCRGVDTFEMVGDQALHKILEPASSGWTPDLGEKGAQLLMEQDLKPDVIVCASDRLAIGAMRWLQQNGYRVPDDIGVTGFDNIPDSSFTFPPLTTVNVHKSLLGELAAERVVRHIQNPDEVNLHIMTPTELVIRQSCGADIKS